MISEMLQAWIHLIQKKDAEFESEFKNFANSIKIPEIL